MVGIVGFGQIAYQISVGIGVAEIRLRVAVSINHWQRSAALAWVYAVAQTIAINVSVLQNVEFAAPGAYYVEVLVDDVMKLRYPVNIVVVPQPGAAVQPPPTAPQ